MQTVPKIGRPADPSPDQTARSARGLRRLTPAMLPAEATAHRFAGGDITPGQALAAIKSAAPQLGISPRLVHVVDWLFRFTQPQDWQPGAQPIVWPSSSLMAAEMGVTDTQARRITRQLAEAGLIVMRDSPNGKRYGRRDARGRIVEAYGFDLSPIGARLDEFKSAAEAYRIERAAVARLRRRATIARNSLRQTWETYREQDITDPALPGLKAAAEAASRALRRLDAIEPLTPAVERLESVAQTARRALEMALANGTSSNSVHVEMSGLPDKNVGHITTTNQTLNPPDTVVALDKGSRGEVRGSVTKAEPVEQTKGRTDSGAAMKLRPDELIGLAPRLKPYLRRPSPTWPEIVDAADWVRHDLGISKSLWGDACITMGRERAAIALAIVSAKPASHFRTTPGGYFAGMVEKARTGALHLDRTIWGMRDKSASGHTSTTIRGHA